MSLNKVFGIISYFPNNDSAYHIETRKERSQRFRGLLFTLEKLWADTDIMIIAQNWQDFELPEIKNKVTVYHYDKLGILGARRELRKQFLNSEYDYLIMLDDDGMITSNDPAAYMAEIDRHPNGMGVIRHINCPLMLLAISKSLYAQVDMPNIDPEKGQGYEDDIFVATCFANYPNRCFDFPKGIIEERSFHYKGEGKCPSTWDREKSYNRKAMSMRTKSEIQKIEKAAKANQKVKKVFGIISYFPNNEGDYYIEMRRERRRRCDEMLLKLNELWSDVDIMFVAQNWQDYQPPEISNKITVYRYTERLGIVGARKELRRRFLESDYDCLIMIDDDARIVCDDPQAYIDIIDKHPDGFGAVHGFEHGPMNFLAISRYVYSQVDLPDVDPEKGQGFEDDVFFATCISKFPDKQFQIPKGLITETSLHYHGPGECPSTWSEERPYDWKGMRKFTDDKLYEIEHQDNYISDVVENPSIDLIITYVNGSDSNWISSFVKATKTHSPAQVRYRSWGTLKYLLRGVARYMPFIRNVILVVSSESQVPYWVNRDNVRVVYHEDFIPHNLLPTFNSCTIESFFWNIPGLADRVIYFNDDIFPVGRMTEADFFTENKPHIKFAVKESYSKVNTFSSQVRTSMDLITTALNKPAFEPGKLLTPSHISMAISKSSMDNVGKLCKDQIIAAATKQRNSNNVNQYIYAYYSYFTDNYVNETVKYRYYDIKDTTIREILAEIENTDMQLLCLNDSEKIKDFANTRYKLTASLDKKFPKKSKFEV